MHSPETNSSTTGPRNILEAAPRFGSTKLAPVIIRAALMLAAISALVLIAALPAQAQSGPFGVVSPATLNFRGALGQTSAPQLVSLKNTGGSELTISNISISGDFAIATNHCANGVKPGTHCNVYVTFTPSGLGKETGTLAFVDNASNSPQIVSLTGTIGEIVLYNFTGGSDGGWPGAGLVSDGAGNFYGMTYPVTTGYGTVFEVSPNGSGGWNETVIYNFTCGSDGGGPTYNSLLFASGNLYGTTQGCGANGWGVVFELSPVGTSWTETVLYGFGGIQTDGGGPLSGLIKDAAGNLFGTTVNGGTAGCGTVFELSPSGGGWTERVIYNVESWTAGALYAGLTMDAAGNIFGATSLTAFELSPNGDGGWNPTVLHTFQGSPKDGSYATGTPVLDKAGNLYGTTRTGGAYGVGTAWKLRPVKNGKWSETILHSFGNRGDGVEPWAGIVLDAAGNIYGTTTGGGLYGGGTVYELVAPAAGKKGYVEKALWNFNGTDGATPYGAVVLDSAGNLYGTTQGGGSYGNGVVFEVIP